MSADPEESDAYRTLLQNYRDLVQALRPIREAIEPTFGGNLLPPLRKELETPVHECEAIARAIYAAGERVKSSGRWTALGTLNMQGSPVSAFPKSKVYTARSLSAAR